MKVSSTSTIPPGPPIIGIVTAGHRFANAMRHEPCSFILHAQRPHQLMAADTLLAAAEKIDSLQPLKCRDMAGFENGSDRDSENFFAASVALAGADLRAGAVQLAGPFCLAAMRANRAVRQMMVSSFATAAASS